MGRAANLCFSRGSELATARMYHVNMMSHLHVHHLMIQRKPFGRQV